MTLTDTVVEKVDSVAGTVGDALGVGEKAGMPHTLCKNVAGPSFEHC